MDTVAFKDGETSKFLQSSESAKRKENTSRTILVLKIVCALLALLSLALIIALIVVLTVDKTESSPKDAPPYTRIKDCPQSTKLEISSPARSAGVYDDLSKEEILAVRDYILSQPSLNVTPYQKAAINDNYIYLI